MPRLGSELSDCSAGCAALLDMPRSAGQKWRLEVASVDQSVRRQRLAIDLPAPRDVTPEQMAEAAIEARQFRAALDRAIAGMETLDEGDEHVRLR